MKITMRNDLLVLLYIIILRVSLNLTIGIQIFSLGMLLDIGIIMFFVMIISSLFKKNRNQKIFYIIIMMLLTVITVGDIMFYRYFKVLLSVTNIHSVKWLRAENGGDYSLSIPSLWIYLSSIIVVLGYYIIKKKEIDRFNGRILSGFLVSLVVSIVLIISWSFTPPVDSLDYYDSDAYLYDSMYDKKEFSDKYGYFNYHIIDLLKQNKSDENDYDNIDEFFDQRPEHQINNYSDTYNGYNVITILAETLDTRFIDPILTPNLYQMSTEGMSFDNYYTTVFQNGATCNSEYMSITGLNAVSTDELSINACDQFTENTYTYSLPNQLENIGYETYYFHSGYYWLYDRDEMIPSFGFDNYKFMNDIMADGHPQFNDRLDTDMMLFFEEYVEDYDNPFYINLLTYSMHGAYDQTDYLDHNDQVNNAHPEELNPEIRVYMQKLVEFDNLLGEIMAKLEAEGQLDNTLFAIYPDHYPYMMDYDFYLDYHDLDSDYELKRQELIIYATNMTPTVINTVGSTEDVTPTILNLLNSNSNFKYLTGNDLLSNIANYTLFNDHTVTDGENYLNINGTYSGDPSQMALLQSALLSEITITEMNRKIQHIDYFKLKENNE